MFSVKSLNGGGIGLSSSAMKWISTLLPVVAAVFALSLVSCDKVKELYQAASDKVKEAKGDGEESEASDENLITDVTDVNEKEGKEIIQNESRLVMVEFYSDT